MDEIRSQLSTTLLAKISGDASDPMIALTNTTQKTLRLLETVASNTGWIPQIFNNFQNIESLANRSFHVAMQNQALLRTAQQNTTAQISSTEVSPEKNSPASDVSNKTHPMPVHDDGASIGESATSSKEEGSINRDSLETLYSTSLQLKRIMPALTKLLSEPGE